MEQADGLEGPQGSADGVAGAPHAGAHRGRPPVGHCRRRAFYALLAIFPALVALVAIYGLLLDPQQVIEHRALAHRRSDGVAGAAGGLPHRPNRRDAQWSWADRGALLAIVIWLLGSAGLSWYVENLGNFNTTYGSLGAVVVMLLWFLLSAYAVLLGAELNAELEHGSAAGRESREGGR